MARTSIVIRHKRLQEAFVKALAKGKRPHFPTRVYNRCRLCARVHGYMRIFDICRICFRELAREGLIPGVTKSSW